MSDDKFIKQLVDEIMSMTMAELLAYIIHNPTDLTDSYYRVFGDAIRKRAKELLS